MPLPLVLFENLDRGVRELANIACVPMANQQLLMDLIGVLVVSLKMRKDNIFTMFFFLKLIRSKLFIYYFAIFTALFRRVWAQNSQVTFSARFLSMSPFEWTVLLWLSSTGLLGKYFWHSSQQNQRPFKRYRWALLA